MADLVEINIDRKLYLKVKFRVSMVEWISVLATLMLMANALAAYPIIYWKFDKATLVAILAVFDIGVGILKVSVYNIAYAEVLGLIRGHLSIQTRLENETDPTWQKIHKKQLKHSGADILKFVIRNKLRAGCFKS